MSEEILQINLKNTAEIECKHKNDHDSYEYHKYELIKRSNAKQSLVSLIEILPGKSAYPYHYHTQNEEVFYILSGHGILKTCSGEKNVSAGDLLFFPANEKGGHKLTNISETETLVYLDFSTQNEIDAAFYPDSGKIGIWGKNINKIFKAEEVDYYADE